MCVCVCLCLRVCVRVWYLKMGYCHVCACMIFKNEVMCVCAWRICEMGYRYCRSPSCSLFDNMCFFVFEKISFVLLIKEVFFYLYCQMCLCLSHLSGGECLKAMYN